MHFEDDLRAPVIAGFDLLHSAFADAPKTIHRHSSSPGRSILNAFRKPQVVEINLFRRRRSARGISHSKLRST